MVMEVGVQDIEGEHEGCGYEGKDQAIQNDAIFAPSQPLLD